MLAARCVEDRQLAAQALTAMWRIPDLQQTLRDVCPCTSPSAVLRVIPVLPPEAGCHVSPVTELIYDVDVLAKVFHSLFWLCRLDDLKTNTVVHRADDVIFILLSRLTSQRI
jgi:hypothetical protein